MSNISITVSIPGKKPQTLEVSEDQSCGAFRRQMEETHNFTEGGLRLIHKGKTPSDNTTLKAAGIVSGTKLLLLRTAKQGQADRDSTRRAKLRNVEAAVDAIKSSDPSSSSQSTLSKSATSTPVQTGDASVEGVSHVILQHGRARLRVNLPALDTTATVTDLRARAAELLVVRPDAIRLLCKGRELHDKPNETKGSTTSKSASTSSASQPHLLRDAGVRNGSVMLVLLSREQHERVRRAEDGRQVADDAQKLSARVESFRKRVRHRLVDGDELLLARGELLGEVSRLLSNLDAAIGDDGDDDKAADVRSNLQQLQRSIEDL